MSLASQVGLLAQRIALEIKNRTTPATGAGTSSFLINHQQLTQVLGMVTVELDLGNASTAMSGGIFALPAGFRPKYNRLVICPAYTGAWNAYANVVINTDGSCQIVSASGTITALSLVTAFVKGS